MKNVVRVILAVSVLMVVLGNASPAAARGPARIVNVFEVDALGNVTSSGALTLNGRPISIGDRLSTGLIQNTGSQPAVLALSNGSVLKLEAGQVTMVEDLAATQKCVCKCGTENMTIGETDKDKCAAHSGEDCLMSSGVKKQLYGCSLTWVEATPTPADPTTPTTETAQ
jgi:hypothetical protein